MLSTLRYEDLPSYEIGLEKGMERGMETGIKKGIQEGKVKIAKTMKQEGIEIDLIARITGLSIQVIKTL